MDSGRLLSVNVGALEEIELGGETVQTGIYKRPVAGRVRIVDDHVEGDRQGNPSVHGGYDKAAYAYAAEDYAWWEQRLGAELEPGRFGENLTTEGIDASSALIGERWRIGTALVEVAEPRRPCSKLGHKMGDPRFPRAFLRELRLGAYLRIVEPGEVGAGDPIEVVSRPDHRVSVRTLGELTLGRTERATEIAVTPQASEQWRELAASKAG